MGTSTAKSSELSRARKAVAATMKLKMSKLLFNQPVDPEALGIPNYRDVVKQPMDLGTIHSRLSVGEHQKWQRCDYKTAREVYRDVSVVWDNCVLYNSREVDKPTREAALEVKAVFDQNWKEAGLDEVRDGRADTQALSDCLPESSVSQTVGTEQDGVSVPLRRLDAYHVVHSATGEPADLVQAWSSQLVAHGDVMATDGQGKKQKKPTRIATGKVLDWSFTYGAESGVWICTELAWYKLVSPSAHYTSLHQQMQQRLELCTTSVKLLKHNSSLTPLAAAQNAYDDINNSNGSDEQQQAVIAFVEAQLLAWMEAAAGGSSKKAKLKSMSGIRLGKNGLAVSGKTAAAAALAASQMPLLPGAGKKRKSKASAVSPDPPSTSGKKRRVDVAAAEGLTPSEAKGKAVGSSKRPPKLPQDEGHLSRLGREAARRGHKGTGKRPAPSPAASDDSEEDEDAAADVGKEEAYQAINDGSSVRRTRQAATRKDAAPESRRKSKLKGSIRNQATGISEAEQAKRDSQATGRSRVKREKEEHAARGPVPEPCRDFRLPQSRVPALLMVWELTQVLGAMLQLAPCPFWRLEAAIAPGPRLHHQSAAAAHQDSQPEAVRAEEEEDASQPEATTQTRKRRVSDNQGEEDLEARKPSEGDCSQAQPQPSIKTAEAAQLSVRPAETGIDAAGSASAVLLRDIHCCLLRMIQNQGLEKEKKEGKAQPVTAKLFSPDSGGSVPWTAQLAQLILAAPLTKAAAAAKAAALKLAYMEYSDLSLDERLALLQGLLEQALDCEEVRELMTSKVEAMALPRQKKPVKDGGTPGPVKEPPANPKELEVTAQPGSCEEWVGWMEACRVGWRKALGYDMQRRRYWALGGGTGAWRVYVEEQEGCLWGWYEGQSLSNLVEWLKAAAIDREAGLLKALSQAPLPKKVPTEGHSTKHTISSNPEEPGELLSSSELEARRPDGFKFIVAPVLRGEGNWPSITLYGTMEQRIHFTVDALLARIPFWFKGETWLARHAHVLQVVGAARSGADMAKALLFVERMLCEQDMMQPHWGDYFQPAWRKGLAKCTESRQVIMYLAALQEHMLVNADVLPRQGFNQMARNMRCQLYFPYPTEQVVLLRTGVLVHINAYMKALGLTPSTATARQGSAPQNHTDAQTDADSAGQAFPKAQPSRDTVIKPTLNGHVPKSDGATPSDMHVDSTSAADKEDHDRADVPQASENACGDGGEHEQDVSKLQSSRQAVAAVLDWHGPIKPEKKEQLRAVWQHLKETVEALPHVACYTVASIAYQRSLVETLPEDEEAVVSGQQARRPVAWLLLRPARSSSQQRQPLRALALPISCDAALPDFIVKADVFEKGMRRHWHRQDRFRMFFASSYTNKTGGGVYYKGTVTHVRQQMPSGGINLMVRGDYDPWEALEVEWDVGGDAEGMDHVSPWEIENDPEEERRLLEEQRKAQEAAARTARIEAKAAKARRIADGLDSEDEEEEAEQSPSGSHPSPTSSHDPAAGSAQSVPVRSPHAPIREVDRAISRSIDQDIAAALAADAAFFQDPALSLGEGALQPVGGAHEEGYEQPALSAGGTISKEVLDLVRGLDKDPFTRLLINWYRRAKGKYKVPTFAHQELDLHKVFWEVQDKGGYDQVTTLKLWKEICRSLELDLTGQTSASYNMRLNYEKCLLEFEKYLAFGQYSADLAAGTAPPTHILEAPPAVRPPQGTGFMPGPPAQIQGTRASARLAAAGPNPFSAADDLDDLSFTELLNMDLEGPDTDMALAPHPSANMPEQQPGVSSITRPRSRRGGPGTAPQGGSGPAYRLIPPHQSAGTALQGLPAVVQSSGGPSVGWLLQGLGRRLTGKKVMRFWPDNGGWWEADVHNYNASTGQHRLSYDEGEDEESFEWVDFRELTDQEVRQHPSHIVVQSHPPPAPRPPATPATAAKAGSADPEKAAMSAIMAALRSGIAPSVVHSMVDVAATALRVTAPTPASPPRPHTLSADALHPPSQPKQSARQQPAPSELPQQNIQDRQGSHKAVKAAAASEPGPIHPASHEPMTSAVCGTASRSAAVQSQAAAMPDAPYSFRRHRRMDLQPQAQMTAQHPSLSSAPPSATESVSANPRLRSKQRSSAAEAAPAAAGEAAAEPPAPVRTSVRVKLRRTPSANKQPGDTGAVSGKQGASSHAGRRRHQRSEATAHADDGARHGHLVLEEADVDEAAVAGSRMQSSSGAHSALQLHSQQSPWQSEGALQQQEQQVDEVSSARAGAVSGHSKSQDKVEPDAQEAASQDAFGSVAEGAQAGSAAGRGHHDDCGRPDAETVANGMHGDDQPAGQSHVNGAHSTQAQGGDRHGGMYSAQSDIAQPPPFREVSMTESNAAGDVPAGVSTLECQQLEGMPSTQACQTGTSGDGPQHGSGVYGQSSRQSAGAQAGDATDDKGKMPSSSTEVASPQQLLHQAAGQDGSKSVDQLPMHVHGGAHASHIVSDRAESQLHISDVHHAGTQNSDEHGTYI